MHECTHHPRKQKRKKRKDKDVPMTHHRFGCLVSAPNTTADYTVDIDVVHPSFYTLLRRSASLCSGEGLHRTLASRA
jgi:hypothetical protein